MNVVKVIAGGQTGADQGGLIAGKLTGRQTGGHIPLGFLTENGPTPELGALYGLIETDNTLYPPRTILNVGNSHGTIRFAADFKTRGEKCTLRAIKDLKKHHIDVNVLKPISIDEVAKWIYEKQISVLNVAGNRESTWPGMQVWVTQFLVDLFGLLDYNERGNNAPST